MAEDFVSYRSPSYFEIANQSGSDWREHRPESYRDYRREWDERPARQDHGEFPLHLDLDPTNACNLKCAMCPRTHYIKTRNRYWAPDGKIGFMSRRLFTRVIDQAAEGGVYSIKMNFLGEPLLHPNIVNQVRYAKQKGLEVMMNTNATLLSPSVSRQLLEAGLDDLFFSVDSPYPEEYERIRVGARFQEVIDNIGHFVGIKEELGRRHVQTRVSMVLDEFKNTKQVREDFKRLFIDLGVAEIGFGLPSKMNVDYWKKYGLIDGFACRDIFHRLFVYWDGLVGPCCGEWERRYIMGDANSENIGDIWHNERYRLIREAHINNRYETIPICRQCSVPWLSAQNIED